MLFLATVVNVCLMIVGFLLIYVAYVLVVVLGRYIRKKFQKPGDPPITPIVDAMNPATNFSSG